MTPGTTNTGRCSLAKPFVDIVQRDTAFFAQHDVVTFRSRAYHSLQKPAGEFPIGMRDLRIATRQVDTESRDQA